MHPTAAMGTIAGLARRVASTVSSWRPEPGQPPFAVTPFAVTVEGSRMEGLGRCPSSRSTSKRPQSSGASSSSRIPRSTCCPACTETRLTAPRDGVVISNSIFMDSITATV